MNVNATPDTNRFKPNTRCQLLRSGVYVSVLTNPNCLKLDASGNALGQPGKVCVRLHPNRLARHTSSPIISVPRQQRPITDVRRADQGFPPGPAGRIGYQGLTSAAR